MNYKILSGWVIFQIFIFLLGFFLQKNNPELSLLNKLGFSVFISRGAGLCLAITPVMMLFPMCRHLVTFLRRSAPSLDIFLPNFSIYFHKICAYTILFWSTVHGICHFINFYGVEFIIGINTMYNLHYTIFGGISGHLMILSMIFIFSTSSYYFRKYYFDLFWIFHHFYIIFFLGIQFHGSGCFVKTNNGVCLPYMSAIILSPVLLIYIIERIAREFKPYTEIVDVEFYDPDIIKIKFNKNDKEYKPGQYLLIKCEKINEYQWHPFTISSSPEDKYFEITIRCFGDWTKNFRHQFLQCIKNNEEFPLIQYDGVFGSPIDTILKYNSVILIATGIGITPYISMIKYIAQTSRNRDYNIKKIDLIWVNRNLESFEWFNKELAYIDNIYHDIPVKINFYMHVTEKIETVIKLRHILSKNIPHLSHVYKTGIPLNYGRPDFYDFFKRYSKNNDNLKVGCFVCSSKNVEIVVKNACKKYSNNDIKFIFNSEKFY